MRIALWLLGSLVVLSASATQVQRLEPTASARPVEAPEEIVVRGRQLAKFRLEVQTARERAYAIFNEINSNDDFDVRCRDERKYHSRATRRVCRPQFESRIAAEAGAEYMDQLRMECPPTAAGPRAIQDCIFSGYGQQAANAARRVELQLPGKRDQMTEEIVRLANANDEFAQAILDFYEASQQVRRGA